MLLLLSHRADTGTVMPGVVGVVGIFLCSSDVFVGVCDAAGRSFMLVFMLVALWLLVLDGLEHCF